MLSLNFSLSIGSGYLLTPLVKNRAVAYCKPPPPVRLTTSSRGDRVLTHPPPWGIGRARYRIAFCIFIHCICSAYYTITPRPCRSSFSSSSGGSKSYSLSPCWVSSSTMTAHGTGGSSCPAIKSYTAHAVPGGCPHG